MDISFNVATSAYGQAQKIIDKAAKQDVAQIGQSEEKSNDFSAALQENLQSVVETGKVADQKSMEMLNGEANVVDVVTAIAEAEIAIESMVTIRDRVIKAYEEIMRMPI